MDWQRDFTISSIIVLCSGSNVLFKLFLVEPGSCGVQQCLQKLQSSSSICCSKIHNLSSREEYRGINQGLRQNII